jgi:hypothetical protein
VTVRGLGLLMLVVQPERGERIDLRGFDLPLLISKTEELEVFDHEEVDGRLVIVTRAPKEGTIWKLVLRDHDGRNIELELEL